MSISRGVNAIYQEAIRLCHPDRLEASRIETGTRFTAGLNGAKAEGNEGEIIRLASIARKWAASEKVLSRYSFTTEFGMKMIKIDPGSFTMGSADGTGFSPWGIEPPRTVKISRRFWMARTPVTNRQFDKIMGTKCPRGKGHLLNHPVTNVSWEDANHFCNRVTEQSAFSGIFTFQLPTEAQWEYSCRAGTSTLFAGENLGEMAWFSENSGRTTHPVAKKKPNAWKLYDMHGNVFEWCSDRYGKYREDDLEIDPQGPLFGKNAIFRGGSSISNAEACRCDYRFWGPFTHKTNDIGFRLAGIELLLL